jgi:hypothetical protein
MNKKKFKITDLIDYIPSIVPIKKSEYKVVKVKFTKIRKIKKQKGE